MVRARRERKLTVGMTVASWLLSLGTSAVSAALGASLQDGEVILIHSMSHIELDLKNKWHYK